MGDTDNGGGPLLDMQRRAYRERSSADAGSFLSGFILGAASAALLGLMIVLATILQ